MRINKRKTKCMTQKKKTASTTIIQADTVNAKLTGTDGNLLTLN